MTLYCTCRRDFTGVWYDGTGQTNDLQVHPKCRKPHRAYFERFTAMRAPRGAVALINIHGRESGINELTFAMHDGSREMVEVLSTQPDVVLQMWQMIDYAMDHIVDQPDDPSKQAWKARARTLGEVISMCMPKHYADADAVAAEAMLRYESGDAEGNVTRRTPGLADDDLKPPARPVPSHNLDEAQINFIRGATDVIPVPELATMFKVPESVITSLL